MELIISSLIILFAALVVYWTVQDKTNRMSRLAKEEADRQKDKEYRQKIEAENWKTLYSNKKTWTKEVPDPDFDRYDTYQNRYLTEVYGWAVTVRFSDVLNTYEITHRSNSNDVEQSIIYKEEYLKAVKMASGSNVIIIG